MQEERACPLLPGVKLPKNVSVGSNLEEALAETELVFLAVPSDKVELTISKAAEFIDGQAVILCSKGFAKRARLLSEVVQEKVSGDVFCLYGPTHAEEVGRGMFSGIVLAGGEGKEQLKIMLQSEDFHIDLSEDTIGVQVAAALKNVLAIFVGVLDGLKLGDNAKAYVITKGLAEIKKIGLAWGAEEETFDGLAGLGDVLVTCTSKHSRNRFLGEQIGKGRKLEEVLAEMKMVAEGVTAVKQAFILKEKFGLELPLITGIYQILFEGKNPREVIREI